MLDVFLFVAAGPVALAAAALVAAAADRPRSGAALAAARWASLFALGGALVALVAFLAQGRAPHMVAWVHADALSLTMAALVSGIGAAVIQFSRAYLDGDARQGRFLAGLCLTLAFVLTMVTARDMVLLAAAWIGASLSLHQLLVFNRERPAARIAARKKFVAARIGDVCLVAAVALLASAYGTTEIRAVIDSAGAALQAGAVPAGAQAAAALIAVAAALKCAQFPMHGWLPEVMETPTPVSALLHAGVINAGGFLVIRFADVMLGAPQAMIGLAVIGGLSALVGAAVAMTQPSIKVQLAYSTLAQMGFMLLQCGLGAFAAAALHIVAHSLYKAHAFLSSGSAVERLRIAAEAPKAPLSIEGASAAVIAVVAAFGAVAALVSTITPIKPAIIALGVVFALGLVALVAEGLRKDAPGLLLARLFAIAAALSGLYFAVQAAAAAWFGAAAPNADTGGVGLAIVVGVGFAVLAILQLAPPTGRFAALRVHVANGFYANALINRLTGALRIGR